MKRRSLATFLALFVAAAAIAGGGSGSDAGNGGGVAEKNIIFAYMSLDRYLDLCLESGLCRLTGGERALLERIRGAVPKEQSSRGGDARQLVFDSERKHPGFFMIDGQVRVAKTGDHVGDPIYLNSDLLYFAASGGTQAVDIPLGASILVHELGHHQGARDHAALDVLGSKIQALLLTQSERAEFWNGNAALITFQLNAVRKDADKAKLRMIDQVLLENDSGGDSELVPLEKSIVGTMRCPKGEAGPLGLRFYNLHEERGVTFDEKSRILIKPVQGWYVLSCETGKESDHGNIEMRLAFRKLADGTFRFQPNLMRVAQISCMNDAHACR